MKLQRVIAGALLALGLAAAPGFALAAEQPKIGVIHIERILRDSPPARAALSRIEQQFKPRDTEISVREQEVQAAAAQYEKDKAGMSAEARGARERDLEARAREVERARQQFAEDLRARQFEELEKLKERLDQVLTRLAHDQNYDLILQSALWVGKSVDITDDVIKALGP
jgi:outer membrane protein